MKFKTVLFFVLIWRLAITLFSLPAIFLLSLKDGFSTLTSGFSLPNLFTMWSNFDGRHFLSIASGGYSSASAHRLFNFFPLYPLLITKLNFLADPLITGLILSHLFLALALYFLYKLIGADFSEKIARTSIILLLFFPASFFFGSVYAESLLLLLSVTCFYALRKDRLLLAVILAALASATRFVGILLWFAIIIELWEKHHRSLRRLFSDTQSALLAIPPLGLLLYMNFQRQMTGNFLEFLADKPEFASQAVVGKIILLYQVFYRYLRMIIFINHEDPLFFTVLLEFLIAALFLVLVILCFKKFKLSYAFFSLFAYLLPSFTGTFASLPRYVLVIFPAFIILAIWFQNQNKSIRILYLALNIIFSIIAISLFTRGYFVS